jgi:aminoglycoside 3-N-acetyltransferase I
MNLSIQQIVPEDVALMEALLATFGEAFDKVETYRNPQGCRLSTATAR